MRRTLSVLLVVMLVVIAGCTGGLTGDDGGDPTVELDENDDAVEETDEPVEETDEPAEETDEPVDGELEVHHLDVGQADATLLIAPSGETMLIDTGDWRQDGQDVIDFLEELGVDRIDHLVATHAHADHIGGHEAVIDHFEEHGDGVGAAYDSGVAHTSQTYERYLDAIERHDVTLFEVREGDEIPFEGVDVLVLNPPEGDGGSDLHYNSVSLAIEFGEFSYLTTGDAEADAEARMVEDWADELEADVYQAGHHGSSTSSTEPFLEAASPEAVVISSALESQYGHPHDEVLESFADRGLETYWTAVHGDVVVTTDGETVTIEPEREGPTDAAALLEAKPDDESVGLVDPSSGLASPGAVVASIDVAGAPTLGA